MSHRRGRDWRRVPFSSIARRCCTLPPPRRPLPLSTPRRARAWSCDAACSERDRARATARRTPREQRQPLRVALLSDLDADPSASLLTSVLPWLHQSKGIRLTLLSTSARAPSAHLEQIARAVPTVWLPATSSAQDAPELCEAQEALRELEPHIILEAMGYLPGQQLSLLARSCTRAPVHASWLRAFHGSMRASFVDYTMVDARALPVGTPSASGYLEAAVLLPHQHLANSHSPSSTQTDANDDSWPRDWPVDAPIACSLNRVNKLDPSALDAWTSGLLRSHARLWVHTGAGQWTPRGRKEASSALRGEAAARGLARRHLLTAPRASTAERHMARVSRCALAFDSRRWGAHTTAVDALVTAVGVLSAPGEALATRASHSLLHAVGAPPLSSHSLREYSDLSAALLARGQQRSDHLWRPSRGRTRSVALEVV